MLFRSAAAAGAVAGVPLGIGAEAAPLVERALAQSRVPAPQGGVAPRVESPLPPPPFTETPDPALPGRRAPTPAPEVQSEAVPLAPTTLRADPKKGAQLLAKSLYKDRNAAVVLREAYQNAFDAARDKHGKKGRVGVQVDFDTYEIRVTDNGSGLTPQEVLDRLLVLGESGKTDGQSAGGFGIGSATMFTHPMTFRIETVAREGRKKVKTWIEGRSDQALNDDDPLRPFKEEVPSDTPTGTTYTAHFGSDAFDADRVKEWIDTIVGSPERKDAPRVEVTDNRSTVGTMGSADFVTPPPDPHLAADEIASFGTHPLSTYGSNEPGTFTVVPSKGLQPRPSESLKARVYSKGAHQFDKDLWLGQSYENLPAAIHVDIHSLLDPKDTDYPFTLSRDDWTWKAGRDVKKVLDEHVIAPILRRRAQIGRAHV